MTENEIALTQLQTALEHLIGQYRMINTAMTMLGGEPKSVFVLDDQAERQIIQLIRANNLPRQAVKNAIKEVFRLT